MTETETMVTGVVEQAQPQDDGQGSAPTMPATAPQIAPDAPERALKPLPLLDPADPASVDWTRVGFEWITTEPEMRDNKPTGRQVPLHVSEKGQTYYGAQIPVVIPGMLQTALEYVPEAIFTGALDASGFRIPTQRTCRQVLGGWREQKTPLVKVRDDGTRINSEKVSNRNDAVGMLDEMHEKLLRKRVWDSLMGIRGETKRAPKVVEVIKIVEKVVPQIGATRYDGAADVDEIRSWYVNTYVDAGVPLTAVQMLVPDDATLAKMVEGMKM